MSDDPIYICNDCGRANDGRQCVCGSKDMQIQNRYSDEAKDGRSREVSYEEYASDFADAMRNRM